MVSQTRGLTSINKIPSTGSQGTATDATPIYTTPTGKKAIANLSLQLVAIGASANVGLMVGGTSIINFVAADFTAKKTYNIIVQLEAGKDLHFHGDVSDNATVNWTLQVQESPA